MAAPQVDGGRRAGARTLNPDLHAADVIRAAQADGPPAGRRGWTAELGWGILDAGRRGGARRARIDRRAAGLAALRAPRRPRRAASRCAWTGAAPTPRRAGCASGVRSYEVYARVDGGRGAAVIARTARSVARARARRRRYGFYTRRRRPGRQPRARPAPTSEPG